MKRRLAAILAADVAQYSTLVQHDELAAVRTVRGHISAFEPQIALHHGRIVKTMGDGFLAEFGSVVDAVACAALLQDVALERNDKLPEPERAVFRMGVHAGDILEEDGDIFGDGVNIAARLEAIAAPGSIAISAKVFEDIDGRLDLAFADAGPQALKNIDKPVHVYRLAAGARPAGRQWHPDLPAKPSVAVLPLKLYSADSEDEFLADSLAEDLTTVLSGVPWLFVIARNSAFTYKGLAVDIREVGAELGVRYVVEGSLRRAGDRIRVAMVLVDATEGRQIWADRYDGRISDVFDFQDTVIDKIATTIAPQVQALEIQRSMRTRPDDRSAYDLFLSGLGALSNAKVAEAEETLQQAIDTYPDYASAKAVLAWCTTLRMAWQSTDTNETLRADGIRLCLEALDSPQCDDETRAYAGYSIAFHLHDIERGRALAAEAVERCPSFAWAWASRAMLEAFFGDPAEGLVHGETALRLNPMDPLVFRTYLALTNCHIGLGDNESALASADRGLLRNPNVMGLQVLKIVALHRLGRADEASAEAATLMARHPNFRVARFMFHTGKFANVRDTAGALLASGLPD